MSQQGNAVRLEFVKPQNGVIANPGFCSEFAAADWAQHESRNAPANEAGGRDRVQGKDRLLYEPHVGAVMLRPNLEPVDMPAPRERTEGRHEAVWNEAANRFDFVWRTDRTGFVGENFELGGDGRWELARPVGHPAARTWFHPVVQVPKETSAEEDEEEAAPPAPEEEPGEEPSAPRPPAMRPAAWWLHAECNPEEPGRGYLAENQGVTVWLARNLLPEGKTPQVTIHLLTLDDEGRPSTGIIVEITPGKEAKIAHYTGGEQEGEGSIPPALPERVQWETVTLPENQPLYEWGGGATVYTILPLGRWIILGVNGIEQAVAVPARAYRTASDADGRPYPVLMEAGASLWIHGQGQAMVGCKPAVFERTGEFLTPLVFPGYRLAAPAVEAARSRPRGGELVLTGLGEGRRMSGGAAEIGPLGTSDGEYGYYARVLLAGPPLNPEGDEYQRRVTMHTPLLYRTRIHDARVRRAATGSPPADIAEEISRLTLSYALGNDGAWQGAGGTLDLLCTQRRYPEFMSGMTPLARIYLTLNAAEEQALAAMLLTEPEEARPRANETTLKFKLQDIAWRLRQVPVLESISYDDWGLTDIELMEELCRLAGVNLEVPAGEEGVPLPLGEESKEPAWALTPGTRVWDFMLKVAGAGGRLIYPKQGSADTLIYRSRLTVAPVHADYTLDTGPARDLQCSRAGTPRTRITVVGRAGASTTEHREGDKLVGIWRHRSIEEQLGWDWPEIEIDDALADWPAVRARGEALDAEHNQAPLVVRGSVSMEEAEALLDVYPGKTVKWQDAGYAPTHNKIFEITGCDLEITRFACQVSLTAVGPLPAGA